MRANANSEDRRAPAWLSALATAAGVVLGGVLLVAAWAKAIDPAAFAEQISREGLATILPARAVAIVAVALEAGLGTALLLGLRRVWVLVPTAGLVAFFLALTGRAYWQAAHGVAAATSCGCFGNLVERSPAEAFWQDLLILGVPLLLAFAAPPHGAFPSVRSAAVGLVTAAAAILAWQAPTLPLDDLATRLHPGVLVGDLCTGRVPTRVCLPDVAPGITEGRNLVVLADLDDPRTAAAVEDLNRIVDAPGAPRLWMLTGADDAAQRAFSFRTGPGFEIRQAPESLLRPLYRTLPRWFVATDGKIYLTGSGFPTRNEVRR